MLNIVPPEPENGGSSADNPINSVYLLRIVYVVDLTCKPQPQLVQKLAGSSSSGSSSATEHQPPV
jgi:hypothetical protein